MIKLTVVALVIVAAQGLAIRDKPIIPKEVILEAFNQLQRSAQVDQEAVDNYTDRGLAYVDQYLLDHDYDPITLPDESEDFDYTIIVEYKGHVDLTRGLLFDLATLHRLGNVHVFTETDGVYLANIPVEFHDWRATYDFDAEIAGLSVSGGVEAYIRRVEVQLVVQHNSHTQEVQLLDFEVIHNGNIEVDFTGHTLVDWLLDLLADSVVAVLEPRIIHALESIVGPTLHEVFVEINQIISSGSQ